MNSRRRTHVNQKVADPIEGMPIPRSTPTKTTISEGISDVRVGPCRVLLKKTPINSVVSWRGSFLTHPNFANGEELVQDLAVRMLDKGTQKRDQYAIAELIEDRGAQLRFSSEGLKVGASGRALAGDVPVVLGLMAEQLMGPLFDAEEYLKVVAKYRVALHRASENTRAQAESALSRCIFERGHPNYSSETESTLASLDSLSILDLEAYYKNHFGANELVLVFVGDIDENAIFAAVEEAFSGWSKSDFSSSHDIEGRIEEPELVDRPIPDKSNFDICMGHALPETPGCRLPSTIYCQLHFGR